MNWFRRKPDPITDRTRALSSEIEALEEQIRHYELQLQDPPTTSQRGTTPFSRNGRPSPVPPSSRTAPTPELNWEEVDQRRMTRDETVLEAPVNDLGLPKYDLPGVLTKLRKQLRPAGTSNPRLVNYLAAGGIQGLRPLRYERRIARNRFLLLFGIFFLVLLGILSVFLRQQ